MRQRTTIDVWYIFVNYGDGFGTKPDDAECTELGYYQFLVNKLAYQESCQYPIQTRKGRMKKSDLPGDWNDADNRLQEAKAEVEYRKALIRINGTNDKREKSLRLAVQKLERLQRGPQCRKRQSGRTSSPSRNKMDRSDLNGATSL